MRTREDQARQDLATLTLLLEDQASDMPPERGQQLKDHLSTEIRRPPARHECGVEAPVRAPTSHSYGISRRRARLILGAGVAVAVAAAAIAVVSLRSGSGLAPASPGAARLLAKVADAAARQPAAQVGDGQYMYAEIKETTASLPGNLEPYIRRGTLPRGLRQRLHLGKPVTDQYWMPVSDVCRPGLLRITPPKGPVANQPESAGGPGMPCPSIGSLNDASYRLLQTLPTDPRALLAMIYRVERGHGPGADQEAFVTIGDLLRDKIAPPKVSAALYRAAALIPGVTLVPHAADAIGRQGVAVAQTAQGIRTELIFSKTTLRLIGERTILAGIGLSTDATAIITQAFVNHIGQVPGGTRPAACGLAHRAGSRQAGRPGGSRAPPRSCQGRASNTRLNGVSAARRNRVNPAVPTTSAILASPACAPRASPTSCDSDAGVHSSVEKE